LSRLAILSDWRKFGFGRILVEELERAAALAGREGKAEVKDGKVLIKCHSQVSHILMPLWLEGEDEGKLMIDLCDPFL